MRGLWAPVQLIVLVIVLDPMMSSTIFPFDYDYAHEHRFAEHDAKIAGQRRIAGGTAGRTRLGGAMRDELC